MRVLRRQVSLHKCGHLATAELGQCSVSGLRVFWLRVHRRNLGSYTQEKSRIGMVKLLLLLVPVKHFVHLVCVVHLSPHSSLSLVQLYSCLVVGVIGAACAAAFDHFAFLEVHQIALLFGQQSIL